ncbi:NAD(P)H-dependent oxidoreductase [Clostridium gasigenes]|uniref:NAD(P)H-dependent oxidoreductase n=1 Tax=Clostridium gasigenes TaxID=94869 RepID=UPI001438293D|nr:NAD(P)H-dependent oxidoreductase [Clostridium gasigenes]NKF05656.1 NAD(P)H-dependent oxidoreductase [Clostridium gasigenes]QSW19094.1 NAD(P)H-dependent oxidoreductase [Clostridium gasigenes]
MNKNEIMDALNFRHSCKEFDESKKISEANFEVILEGGRLSPSSMGIEPWKFLVIENQELKNELGAVSWGGKVQMPTCSHLVVYLSRSAKELRFDSNYIDYLLKDVKQIPEDVASNYKGVMKSIEEIRFEEDKDIEAYASEQVHIALGNMMNVAASLEIDSCPIGGIDRNAVEKILVNRGLLDTDKFNIAVCAAFGYRVNEPGKKLRQTMDKVVTWVK